MKKILFLSSLLLSLSALAQADKVYEHRVACAKSEKGRESRISQITKEYEDKKEVTFRFVLDHGRCQEIERFQYPIKFQKRMVQLSHYGLSYPFKKLHVRLNEVVSLSDTAAEASITLDKEALKNTLSRRYIMQFWPGNWVGFSWIMKFSESNGETQVNFEGFESP